MGKPGGGRDEAKALERLNWFASSGALAGGPAFDSLKRTSSRAAAEMGAATAVGTLWQMSPLLFFMCESTMPRPDSMAIRSSGRRSLSSCYCQTQLGHFNPI